MAKDSKTSKRAIPEPVEARKNRNFPKHTLEAALPLPQKIQDERGGKPMNRLLLAEALGLSPSSSNFRELLSSSYKYGLTEGTEKAENIALTDIGAAATQQGDPTSRVRALRIAALSPSVFGKLFHEYANKRLPSAEMLPKILRTEYGVPTEVASECAAHIASNGRYVDIVRDIGGSPHVLLDSDTIVLPAIPADEEDRVSKVSDETPSPPTPYMSPPAGSGTAPSSGPKPIFIGHGKNKGPLEQLQRLLTGFRIPHKIVMDEANLGRPIPQKVRDAINECGSAILIFTRDEKFFDESGNEVWRPSENVVHELGATSFAYGDRVVIFKEKGLHFPTNFQSIGYIEFESGDLAARTAELLKELIGFGLVQVTPTG